MTIIQTHTKLCARKHLYNIAFNYYFLLTRLLCHLLNPLPFQEIDKLMLSRCYRSLNLDLDLRIAFCLARRRFSPLETYHLFLRKVLNTPLRVTSLRNRFNKLSGDSSGLE